MHCKLKWGVHSLKTDRGVLDETVATMIAKIAADLGHTPEDIARAWLEHMAEFHDGAPAERRRFDEPSPIRAETFSFDTFTVRALEKERQRRNLATRGEVVDLILHERYLLDDRDYEANWLAEQKRRIALKRRT